MVTQNKKPQTGRLRIVAGKWRSRLLKVASIPGLRPTSERIRETLFNWLTPALAGTRCLDLCAGTGALGIEALSRGAGSVVFVETSRGAADQLRANLAELDVSNFELHRTDARTFLQASFAQPFDIVFLDPPFAADLLDELCRLLESKNWLKSDAQVYLEMDKLESKPELPRGWQMLKEKTAGNVRYMLATPKQERS